MTKSQEVIILVGLPGSGKSTFAHLYASTHTRVCQDELGSRNDCLNVMRLNLKAGKSIIIDRTNINKKQRAYFLDLAKELGVPVHCIYLESKAEECIERIKMRKEHPNLNNATEHGKIVQVVNSFNKDLELPDEAEGFLTVNTVDFADVELLRRCASN